MPSAKYFLYNGPGVYRGIIWNIPITINNILYTFDDQGKVIKEEKLFETVSLLQGDRWEYVPEQNKWKYYHIDEMGKGGFYASGIFPIEYLGQTLYYSFDNNGYLETGLKEIDGNTYYLQETGQFAGAIYTGGITLNGKYYEFGTDGRMVDAMTRTEK
jgi:glucan-binding YG repeat protein